MKFHSGLITYIFLALILINPAYSDVEKGKELSASCAACHGDDGISLNPVWPKLAGQNPKYLASQLHEFKKGPDGNRNNAVMYGIAMTLSDSDINDLSDYYASLKPTVGVVKDDYLELGRNIYRGGNMDIKMQACISCHGPGWQGWQAAAQQWLHVLMTDQVQDPQVPQRLPKPRGPQSINWMPGVPAEAVMRACKDAISLMPSSQGP